MLAVMLVSEGMGMAWARVRLEVSLWVWHATFSGAGGSASTSPKKVAALGTRRSAFAAQGSE